jgi:hypothetical protein
MSDTTTIDTAKAPKVNVAKHEMLAEKGGPAVGIDSAVGIRYTDIKTGLVMEFFPRKAKAGTELTMLALFGAKTKATNEAADCNGEGGEPTRMEAIDELSAAVGRSAGAA